MKPAELREMTFDQLDEKRRELAQQLFALRLNRASGQLERPSKMREVRKDLARVLTILKEKRSETT